MKFGSRDVCDVVFRAKSKMKLGKQIFQPGQPVLLIDTAKTTAVEGDSETNYATGGHGNAQLLGWDGSKTMTISVEDALFSPIGLSILMGADIAENKANQKVHVHKMIKVTSSEADTDTGIVTLDISRLVLGNTAADGTTTFAKQYVCDSAPLYVIECEEDGSLTSTYAKGVTVNAATITVNTTTGAITRTQTITAAQYSSGTGLKPNTTYVVDCYVIRDAGEVTEIQILKDKFAGYFYMEGETYFKRQDSGNDMPAVLTFPKVKIQSNFSLSLSADGDPATASFTLDAFPDYTYFDKTHEVMGVFQIVDDNEGTIEDIEPVMLHSTGNNSNHPALRTEGTDTYGFSDSDITTDTAGWKYDDGQTHS